MVTPKVMRDDFRTAPKAGGIVGAYFAATSFSIASLR